MPPMKAFRAPGFVEGTFGLECLLDELAAKRIYQFAFVMQPLKLKGATGSTVAPMAIR